jgi:hypothetical protein
MRKNSNQRSRVLLSTLFNEKTMKKSGSENGGWPYRARRRVHPRAETRTWSETGNDAGNGSGSENGACTAAGTGDGEGSENGNGVAGSSFRGTCD